MDEFKEQYCHGASKLRIVNKEADILFDDEQNENKEAFGEEAFHPEINRDSWQRFFCKSI